MQAPHAYYGEQAVVLYLFWGQVYDETLVTLPYVRGEDVVVTDDCRELFTIIIPPRSNLIGSACSHIFLVRVIAVLESEQPTVKLKCCDQKCITPLG